MARNLHVVISFFFFLSLQIGCAVRIEISPVKTLLIEKNTVNISCVPDAQGNGVQKVLVLEISKSGEKPIAVAKFNSISYGKNKKKLFGAQYQVVDNPDLSYLNLTLLSPKITDAGTYTCVMYFIDESGVVSKEEDSGKLNVAEYDVSSLLAVVGKQREMLSDLSAKVAVLTMDSVQGKLLQKSTHNVVKELKSQLSSLTDKVTCKSAFSATTTQFTDPHKGSVVQFPKVIFQVGQGYDSSTSTFTAPMDGLYAFNLVIEVGCTGCVYLIDLKANFKVIGTLKVGSSDSEPWDQSSISTVVKLNRNEQVKAVTRRDDATRMDNDTNVLFNGFLIKCL